MADDASLCIARGLLRLISHQACRVLVRADRQPPSARSTARTLICIDSRSEAGQQHTGHYHVEEKSRTSFRVNVDRGLTGSSKKH